MSERLVVWDQGGVEDRHTKVEGVWRTDIPRSKGWGGQTYQGRRGGEDRHTKVEAEGALQAGPSVGLGHHVEEREDLIRTALRTEEDKEDRGVGEEDRAEAPLHCTEFRPRPRASLIETHLADRRNLRIKKTSGVGAKAEVEQRLLVVDVARVVAHVVAALQDQRKSVFVSFRSFTI